MKVNETNYTWPFNNEEDYWDYITDNHAEEGKWFYYKYETLRNKTTTS